MTSQEPEKPYWIHHCATVEGYYCDGGWCLSPKIAFAKGYYEHVIPGPSGGCEKFCIECAALAMLYELNGFNLYQEDFKLWQDYLKKEKASKPVKRSYTEQIIAILKAWKKKCSKND